MTKFITRSSKYRVAHVTYANMETMEFVNTDVIVENPADDEREFRLQVSDIIGLPVQAIKVNGKEELKIEYRRMDIATWLKYSEVFIPKYKEDKES